MRKETSKLKFHSRLKSCVMANIKSLMCLFCMLGMQFFIITGVNAQDPFTPYLNSIPTVSEIISTTNSGSGASAITTKRLTFKSKGGVNTIYGIMVYPQAAGVYPGMMIYHGGGGHAEYILSELQKYAALGYVTFGIDEPNIASVQKISPYSTGPWTSAPSGEAPRFNVTGGAQNSTLCDAIVGSVEAFNLLSSQVNVDANKMAVTGPSWGGYLTTFVSGLLGNKVKAAYSSYGCGYYEAGSFWSTSIAAMSAADREVWLTYLDAGRRAPGITAPYFIEQPSNDTFFWPEAVQATLDAIPGTKNRFIMANINHALIPTSPAMKELYMGYYLKDLGNPFSSINVINSEPQTNGSLNVNINVTLPPGISATKVELFYCQRVSNWQSRIWSSIPALLVSGTTYRVNLTALMVNQGVNFYANLTDSRQIQVSSPIYKTTPMPVTGVKLTPAPASVNIGATGQMTAILLPSNANNNMAVNWTSSNTSIATVNASGIVKGVALGDVTITVTTQDGGFTAVSQLTVKTAPVNKTISNCDSNSGWTSHNTLSVNSTDKKEGTGCLQSVGSQPDDFRAVFSLPINTGASVAGSSLQFWYYVSDVSRFSAENQVELGSGGKQDINEFNWDIGPLVNGWNLITLPFSSAGISGGTPDLSSINWMRIYHTKTESVTTRVDQIVITDNLINAVTDVKLYGINIYPNPLKQAILTIEIPENEVRNNAEVIITNLQGQKVYQNRVKGNKTFEINPLGLLKSSIYIVSVRSGKLIANTKLIVQ